MITALGDFTIDTFAYTMGGLSVLAQGLYLTLVQQCAENKLSTLEILQLNSYNTLAPFIIVSVLMGEPEAIVRSQYLTGETTREIRQTLIILLLLRFVCLYYYVLMFFFTYSKFQSIYVILVLQSVLVLHADSQYDFFHY